MSLLSCLKSCGDFIAKQSETTYSDPAARVLAEQVLANKLLSIMFETTGTTSLRRKVKGKLPFGGWTETIARHVLDSLVRQLNAGAGVEPKLEKSMQRAHDIVKGGKIAYEYPNLLSAGATLTALGMLTIVVPEAVAALGFKKAEPTTGLNPRYERVLMLIQMQTLSRLFGSARTPTFRTAISTSTSMYLSLVESGEERSTPAVMSQGTEWLSKDLGLMDGRWTWMETRIAHNQMLEA